AGIAFVPESWRDMLFLQEPVYKNVSISILDRISSLLLKPSRERAIANRQVEQLRIRPAVVDLGLAIIVLSTEPETVLSLADRVIVLKRGAVVREFANEQISKDRLLEAA